MRASLKTTFGVLVLATGMLACATAGSSKKNQLTAHDRARLQLDLATASLAAGDVTGALSYAVACEKLDESIADLHHLKALIYFAKKESKLAISSARRAVELNSEYSDANNTLGKLLIDAGQAAEAEPFLVKAAKDLLYRDSYKPQTNLGILHLRKGANEKAAEWFQRAVESSPLRACRAHYYLGLIFQRQGQMREAIRSLDSATQKFCSQFADAHLALGIALERNRDFDRARKKFLDISKAFPNTSVADQALDRLRYMP